MLLFGSSIFLVVHICSVIFNYFRKEHGGAGGGGVLNSPKETNINTNNHLNLLQARLCEDYLNIS